MEGLERVTFPSTERPNDLDVDRMTIDTPETAPTAELEQLPDAETTPPLPLILRLPIELLQLILSHTDAGTFLVSLLTCKHFRDAAATTPLINRHLSSLPGLKLGLDALDTAALLRLFQRRASENVRAAAVLANASHYKADRGCLIARCAVSRHEQARPHSKYITLAVPSDTGVIQLYEATKRLLRKRETLYTHREDGNPGPVHILKTAFSPVAKDLAVLCRQDPNPDEDQVNMLPKRHSKYGGNAITYKLVVFHRMYSKQKGHFYSSSLQEARDIVFWKHFKILDLALSPNGTACVVCQHEPEAKGCLVWLVHRNDELMNSTPYDPYPRLTPVVSHTESMHGQVYSAEFSQDGLQLHLFNAGQQVPSWRSDIRSGDNAILGLTNTPVTIDIDRDGYPSSARVGDVFYVTHLAHERHPDFDGPLCRWTEVFLMYVQPDEDSPSQHPSVFVASSEIYRDPNTCNHVNNMGTQRAVGHINKPLALLGGFRQGESNLGTPLAIPNEGTRIAAAVWDHVYIWTFSPSLLIAGDLNLYFPPADYNSRKGFGRLRPTLLNKGMGIVHSMFWASEDVLYVITDRGLSKFDMGHMCDGTRDHHSLTWDTWSTTALCEPAPGTSDQTLPATLAQDEPEDAD